LAFWEGVGEPFEQAILIGSIGKLMRPGSGSA